MSSFFKKGLKIWWYLWFYWFDNKCPFFSSSFAFSSFYAVVKIIIRNKVDFIFTFSISVHRFQGKLVKISYFCHHIENISINLLWYVWNDGIRKTQLLQKSSFCCDCSLPSKNTILSGTGHKSWLSTSLKFTQLSHILLDKVWFLSWYYDLFPRWMSFCKFSFLQFF